MGRVRGFAGSLAACAALALVLVAAPLGGLTRAPLRTAMHASKFRRGATTDLGKPIYVAPRFRAGLRGATVAGTQSGSNIFARVAGAGRHASPRLSARNVRSRSSARSPKPSTAPIASIAPCISIAQWPLIAAAASSASWCTISNTGNNAISVIRSRNGSAKR